MGGVSYNDYIHDLNTLLGQLRTNTRATLVMANLPDLTQLPAFSGLSATQRHRYWQSISTGQADIVVGARSAIFAPLSNLGMIVVDESPAFLADPFITQLVAGLSNYLSERDYALVLQAVNESNFGRSSLIRRAETDALCALLSGPFGRRRRLQRRLADIDHPIILFQETLPRDHRRANSGRQRTRILGSSTTMNPPFGPWNSQSRRSVTGRACAR